MEKETINNIKLGTFVIGGMLFLVLLLYMIGKNRSLFGSSYLLKARFENVQGLVKGNNVRFAGITAGTVKKVSIIDDTTIEVTMTIEEDMHTIIRKNALVSIGTDGFVGNKLVNIVPSKEPSELAENNDILPVKKSVSTEEMLQTLNRTNNDVSAIAANLKITVEKFNNSSALWTLLNDESIPSDLRQSLSKIRDASTHADRMMKDLHSVISEVKQGKGTAGMILRDTAFAQQINSAVINFNKVGLEAEALAIQMNRISSGIKRDIEQGKGPANYLLKDSTLAFKINSSLDNIQKGTDGFNQNMEALKHNFLFRAYFRRQERRTHHYSEF